MEGASHRAQLLALHSTTPRVPPVPLSVVQRLFGLCQRTCSVPSHPLGKNLLYFPASPSPDAAAAAPSGPPWAPQRGDGCLLSSSSQSRLWSALSSPLGPLQGALGAPDQGEPSHQGRRELVTLRTAVCPGSCPSEGKPGLVLPELWLKGTTV